MDFAWISGIFGTLLLIIVLSKKSPIPVVGEFHFFDALPYILLGVLAMYVVARSVTYAVPNLFTFANADSSDQSWILFPGLIGTFLKKRHLPVFGTAQNETATLTTADVILWNLNVSAAEESFRIVIVILIALFLLNEVQLFRSKKPEYSIVVGLLILVTLLWTYLHGFQAFTDLGDMIIAFVAGLILIAEFLKLKNYLAAFFTHFFWNIFATFAPDICLIRTPWCRPPSLALYGFTFPGAETVDPYILFFIALIAVSWYMSSKKFFHLNQQSI